MELLNTYKALLSEFVAFKSISTDTSYQGEMKRTAQWLQKLLSQNGFTAEVVDGYDNPIVVASYVADSSFETCLVYGHYDVQPASKEDGWESEPFALAERNGRLYARGATDNKGQVLVHIATMTELIKEKRLKYNVKFMIEGNEETGSPFIMKFMHEYAHELKTDFGLLSDGEMSFPTLESGFRGGFDSTLIIKTTTTDLHSGLYGHAAPNAIQELSNFLAGLYDKNNRIIVEGYYEDVDPIEARIKKMNESLPFDPEEYTRITGAKGMVIEKGYDFYTQVGLRPAIEVTGVKGGYTGDGYRNSISGTAMAKINFRLVKSQKPEKIIELFKQHLKKTLPVYIDFEFITTDPYEGIKLDLNNEYVRHASQVFEKSHGKKPVYKYCGGGLPIVTLCHNIWGICMMSVSLANEDCGMHAANENIKLENVEKGLRFSELFFSKGG